MARYDAASQRQSRRRGAVDVFRVRCGACHTLERVYQYLETHGSKAEWPLLVERMRLKAPEWISETEAVLILHCA